MISDKVKALFQFIEYLHSNIENFNQYNGLIKELEVLKDIKDNLKPEQNYKDKLQYNKVQAELESNFKTLQDNTAYLIKAKAKELNLCNFDSEPNYNFNGVETEIRQLKDNFSNEDLPEIFKHKSQYIEYRGNTHGSFLSLQFFFDKLDEIAKSLFDYFKDTDQNEFEPFETKTIHVDSISEAIQGFKKGQTKFSLPNSVLFNTSRNKKLKLNEQNELPMKKDNQSNAQIPDVIHYQLTQIKRLFENDLEKGAITYNYFICQDETNFLDKIALQIYTREIRVENLSLFKSICQNCIKIIELWNIDLYGLPYSKSEEGSVYYNSKQEFLLNTNRMNFHAIYLKDLEFSFYKTDNDKIDFFRNYNYRSYMMSEIAAKCISILNLLTAAYPELYSALSPRYYLDHYLKTGRFNFQSVIKAYKKNELELLESKLDSYIVNYKYILENLKGNKKLELKHDTLDHLENVKNAQVHSKYKTLLDENIELIKDDFNTPPSKEPETNKIIAPVLGLFCNLINQLGINKREDGESAKKYCTRICNEYKLTYTDRVRQNYNVNETRKLINGLSEKVLPLIDTETENIIQEYLDNKQLPKQNLYG